MTTETTESPVSSEKRRGGSRLRFLFGLLFVLLSLHFVLAYTAPRWLFGHLDRTYRGGSDFFRGPAPSGPGHFSDGKRTFEHEGRTWLWGGPNESDHFDVTTFRLDAARLHYGLGREHFAALVEPRYVSVEEADGHVRESDEVLVVKIGEETRVYPIGLLQRHEAVNDVVAGRSIVAVWCILARLGAVYDRELDGHTLTFGVSGYTYSEPSVWDGRQAFVLWDRDTESLWWPPKGQAVSGPLVDTPMRVLEEALWAQTVWKKVLEEHPAARVLASEQTMQRPEKWARWVRNAASRTSHRESTAQTP